jgi:hypothetical protein
MRKRVTWGLGIAGVFLAGLLAGSIVSGALPVFASSNASSASGAAKTKADYCMLYEQTLAKNLNVSTSDLEKANANALQTVINQMASDGAITPQQKTQMEQRLASLKSAPCAHLGALAGGGKHGAGHANGALAGARQAIVAQVAAALHLSASQLDSDLKAGQTVSAITSAQKADPSAVKSAYLSAVQGQLAKAVSAGTLTQAQSDAVYAKIQAAANAGHFPLLERGNGGQEKPGTPGTQGQASQA